MCTSSSESASVSSINSSTAPKHQQTKLKRVLKHKKLQENTSKRTSGGMAGFLSPVIYIMREKHDDQVKLNFTLTVALAGVGVSLTSTTRSHTNSILFTRIQSLVEINNVYEKYSIRLKRFEIIDGRPSDLNGRGSTNRPDKVLLTSNADAFHSTRYMNVKFER